ncbi:hypothetical protein ZIOFF_067732 [Zingiber officinale]|uniref:Uncharacterized protein n=1 Tax=Zingiber officinale TaxID=94328 RepID=A0A8J5CE99_ZINOF|nr:hypothetical protein ZIOFF_067732 [Zingiber officinale]
MWDVGVDAFDSMDMEGAVIFEIVNFSLDEDEAWVKLSGDHIWGLTLAQCWKIKEVGDLMIGEPVVEALVNGSHNYNGPKVAKFLVSLGGRRRRTYGPRDSLRHSLSIFIIQLLYNMKNQKHPLYLSKGWKRAKAFGVPSNQELGPHNQWPICFSLISFFVHGLVRYSGILGIEEPYQSIPNLVVKLYCGDDTVGEVLKGSFLRVLSGKDPVKTGWGLSLKRLEYVATNHDVGGSNPSSPKTFPFLEGAFPLEAGKS